MYSTADKKRAHLKFWNRERLEKPLASFRIGDFFFATHYKAAAHLLVEKKKIDASMLDVDAFLEDYERHFEKINTLDQGAFWTAEPYVGIPWMEAFWGCPVIATPSSFVSEPFIKDIRDVENLNFEKDNPWRKKFFEFVDKIKRQSNGRYPVGQPIMRGPSDVAGAMLGQTEFVIALYEEPELMRRLLEKITESFLEIIKELRIRAGKFEDGYSMGFYHLWSPEESIWFQEDLCALLSPPLYRDFLLEPEKRICSGYKHTMVHMHPNSFFVLDDLLRNENLKVVEINKDVGGPGISEMLPVFKKVLDAKKSVMIWGDLAEDELKLVYDSLPNEGIFLNLIQEDFKTAKRVSDFLNKLKTE